MLLGVGWRVFRRYDTPPSSILLPLLALAPAVFKPVRRFWSELRSTVDLGGLRGILLAGSLVLASMVLFDPAGSFFKPRVTLKLDMMACDRLNRWIKRMSDPNTSGNSYFLILRIRRGEDRGVHDYHYPFAETMLIGDPWSCSNASALYLTGDDSFGLDIMYIPHDKDRTRKSKDNPRYVRGCFEPLNLQKIGDLDISGMPKVVKINQKEPCPPCTSLEPPPLAEAMSQTERGLP
jgi:hypothetical protein